LRGCVERPKTPLVLVVSVCTMNESSPSGTYR
jgi:hypothetical protein